MGSLQSKRVMIYQRPQQDKKSGSPAKRPKDRTALSQNIFDKASASYVTYKPLAVTSPHLGPDARQKPSSHLSMHKDSIQLLKNDSRHQ